MGKAAVMSIVFFGPGFEKEFLGVCGEGILIHMYCKGTTYD